jgi:hypothetical protein
MPHEIVKAVAVETPRDAHPLPEDRAYARHDMVSPSRDR